MPPKKVKKAVKVALAPTIPDVKSTVKPVPDQDETQFKVESVIGKKEGLKAYEIFEGFGKVPTAEQVEKNRQARNKFVSGRK
tara:strand:+ start:72 stop:317 length:246 start_codon:yes stop_codon:yes gene_type:complete